MIRKHLSILMLYSALAIMLGHNFIPHHHHFEHCINSQHQHHDGIPHNHDSEDESSDWGQFFANFHHGASGLIFFTNNTAVDSYTKKSTPTAKPLSPAIFTGQIKPEVRQNVPPYISAFYNSHHYLPFGLRAPPAPIV